MQFSSWFLLLLADSDERDGDVDVDSGHFEGGRLAGV